MRDAYEGGGGGGGGGGASTKGGLRFRYFFLTKCAIMMIAIVGMATTKAMIIINKNVATSLSLSYSTVIIYPAVLAVRILRW